MKKFSKIIYYIKMLFFVIHVYFVFSMLHNILDTQIYGLIFIIFYFLYVIKVIIELLSRKKRYKNDGMYNLMQAGFLFYVMLISIRTGISKMYVTANTLPYFRINFIILSLLILFIFVYGFLEFNISDKPSK